MDRIVGLECSARGCGRWFWRCRWCYRGQRYCSEQCREQGYRERTRIRQRRYGRRPEVRRRRAAASARYRARVLSAATQPRVSNDLGVPSESAAGEDKPPHPQPATKEGLDDWLEEQPISSTTSPIRGGFWQRRWPPKISSPSHFVIDATLPALVAEQYLVVRCGRCGRTGRPFLPLPAHRVTEPP